MNAAPAQGIQNSRLLADTVVSGEYFFLNLEAGRRTALSVALGGREVCDERYRVERDRYPFVTLEYVAEGGGWITFGKSPRQPLQPGTFFAYDQRTPLVLEAAPGRPLIKYFVGIHGRRAKSALLSAGPLLNATMNFAAHQDLRDLFDTLLREGQEKQLETPAICLHLLSAIFLKIKAARGRGPSRSSRSRDRFLAARHHLDSTFSRIHSLDSTARALGMDLSHLNRLFRRFTGTSPYQYLLHKRMTAAAHEFLNTDCLVKEVGARFGYDDPYHFSRVFKSVHGLSPKRFQQLYAGGRAPQAVSLRKLRTKA